jgi:acyl-ACP thioesterase
MLDKTLMPVPDGHPAVFERSWPLRVGDIDRSGRLRLDAAARLIQDIGQDHVHALGFDKTHPVEVVRRTMVDLIRPIEFQDTLRLRRWCSGTSTRWCEIRVRIDGGAGGLIESEAFWININRDTGMPSRFGCYYTDLGVFDAPMLAEHARTLGMVLIAPPQNWNPRELAERNLRSIALAIR